jgi:hypothetical protein
MNISFVGARRYQNEWEEVYAMFSSDLDIINYWNSPQTSNTNENERSGGCSDFSALLFRTLLPGMK